MNPTEQLARHVLATRFEDLPPAAVAAAKTFFLDTLGVTVAGTRAPYAEAVRQAVYGWGEGQDASVLGLGVRLPAANAALVNGFHAHCQEFDCVHEPAVVHPLASIQSALLAYCQRRGGVGGKDLLLALCLGVDAAACIGMASKAKLRFFRPATAGVFGAAAAIAKLAGFDRAALLDAFGLALMQASGTMQAHVEGKPTLALAVGLAARAGLQAADWAGAGMSGPHDALTGDYGYLPLFEGDWHTAPFDELGRVWRIAQVSHKPFPAGRATHGGIDAIQQLRREGLQATQVEKLELIAPPLIQQLVGRPITADMAVNYARLCFQFVGALALRNGAVEIADFRDERLRDPELHALAKRIAVITDDNPDPNALTPQRVVARLRDGGERSVGIDNTLGSPANPLSREAHLDKFRRCWSACAKPLAQDNGERVIERVDRLEALAELDELLALLEP